MLSKEHRSPVRAFRRSGLPDFIPCQSHLAVRRTRAQRLRATLPCVRGEAAEHGIVGEVCKPIDQLWRCVMQELNVISRLSTIAFAGRNLNLDEVRLHLRANYAVSGVCRVRAAIAYVSTQNWSETKTGQIVWENRLSERIVGILEGNHELVGHAVAEISNAIMARELLRTRSQPLPTPESHTPSDGPIASVDRLRSTDFNEARVMLEAILERGSYQPLAQAWLAKWHVLRVQQGWSVNVMEDAHRALELTRRALDLDPELSLALAVDGFVHTNLLKRFDIAQERYNLCD